MDDYEHLLIFLKILISIFKLHNLKIAHRDIKEKNILLFVNEEGRA